MEKNEHRNFPVSPVVRTLPSNTDSAGSIPRWGTKIPHALWPKNQNIKQRQYCNKLNEDFKNGLHHKKKKRNKVDHSLTPYTHTHTHTHTQRTNNVSKN